jgi:hypothetical protein
MRSLKHVGLLLVGIGVGLVVAEFAVRFYLAVVPTPKNSAYISDPDAAYRMRPTPMEARQEGAFFINNFGFYDREHPVEKREVSYRIIGIGDSFVWGAVALEDNFLRVAERELGQAMTGDSAEVEMVLLGLGGYSPENEVGILRSLGLSLDPDLVILNLFVGNDIHLIDVRGEVLRGRRYFVGSPNPLLHVLRRSRAFVLGESFLLTRLKSAFFSRRYRGAVEKLAARPVIRDGAKDAVDPDAHDVTRVYIHIQNKRLPVFARKPSGKTERSWRKAESYLLEFDRLCNAAGVPSILHIIPTEIQIDLKTRRRVLDLLSLPEERYDFDLPQRRLKAFADAHDITILDPLPELRAMHRGNDRLYVPNNTHWNKRGNDLAGRLLADFITEQMNAGRLR